MTAAPLATLVPLLYRPDARAARLHVTAVDDDGRAVFDDTVWVTAVDNPDGRPILIGVTDTGREVRIPIEVAPATAVAR